jgi:hypothetical protein
MKGIKLLILGTLLAVAQQSLAQSSLSVGLGFSYNQGGYGGGYPIGYGTNFGQINTCMQNQYMQSAANSSAYYGPNGYMNNAFNNPYQGYQRPMPSIPPLPRIAPPTPYVRQAPIMAPGGPGGPGGPCGMCQMPPPPCGGGCVGRSGVMMNSSYAGNGIFFGPNGQVIVDDRGIMEWEKNDTAGIMFAVGGTLTGLASNVVPFAPYRYEPTNIPPFYQTGPRQYDFTARPDAH